MALLQVWYGSVCVCVCGRVAMQRVAFSCWVSRSLNRGPFGSNSASDLTICGAVSHVLISCSQMTAALEMQGSSAQTLQSNTRVSAPATVYQT